MADTYRHHATDEYGNVVLGPMFSADEMLGVSEAALQHVPFFDPGGSAMASLYEDQAGSEFAESNRARLLAEVIPALSAPAGASYLAPLGDDGNFNMDESSLRNGWPAERTQEGRWWSGRWLHGDYRTVAYVYTFKVFDKMSRDVGRFDQQ